MMRKSQERAVQYGFELRSGVSPAAFQGTSGTDLNSAIIEHPGWDRSDHSVKWARTPPGHLGL